MSGLYKWVARRACRIVKWRARQFVAPDLLSPHVKLVTELTDLQPDEMATVSMFGLRRLVLIANLNIPQCKKYRVLQKIELLSSLGIEVVFSHWQDHFRSFRLMQLSSALIFYRIPFDDMFLSYLNEARRLGLAVGYDIDDPIFDEDIYGANKNLAHLAPTEREHLIADARNYAAAMDKADYLVTSTGFLQGVIRHRFDGKPVYRLQNFLDSESLACAAQLSELGRARSLDGRVVISYASGSRAHEADFRVAEEALARLMATHKHVDLQVLGYLKLPDSLRSFADRITQLSFTGHCGYLERLANSDIVIVPLVHDSFNDCKSAIRYLEAGLLSKAAVASNVGEFREAIFSGVNGVLCGPAEWFDALTKLVDDSDYRHRLGKAAHEHVLRGYVREAIKGRLSHDLNHLISGGGPV